MFDGHFDFVNFFIFVLTAIRSCVCDVCGAKNVFIWMPLKGLEFILHGIWLNGGGDRIEFRFAL